MTQQPRTPSTPAGRALADDFHNGREGAYTEDEYAERLAAIEAEARADLLAQIEKAVLGIMSITQIGPVTFSEHMISQEAALAAIRSAAPVEPT